MKKILVVTYGGGHVNMLIPVIKELKKNNKFEITVLGLSIAGIRLRETKIPFKTLTDYRDIIFDDMAKKYGQILAKKWHTTNKGMTLQDSIIYFGVSMRDLVKEKGESKAFKLVEEKGRAAFLPERTMATIIDQEKPDLILTTNSPRAERAATIAGKKGGIKTVNMHDYLAFEKRHKLEADRIFVMSEITKQNLIEWGQEADKIKVTGQPAFDSVLDEMKNYNREEILTKIGLSQNKKCVLLGTQPNSTTEEMINSSIKAVEQLPGYCLLIKPHPGEDINKHKSIIKNRENIILLSPESNIREMIFVSDVMITIFSTVGFEAVLMEKPLIQFNLTGEPNPVPLFQYGVAVEVSGKADLFPAINKVLYDEVFKKLFIKNRMKYFGEILTGQGARNIVESIAQMLS